MENTSGHDEPKKRSLFARSVQIGTGLGIIRGNSTPLKAHVTGNAKLWHGTPIENMDSIISHGLKTEFAGKNKRLNSVLLKESLMRDTIGYLESLNVKVTPELEKKIFEATGEALKKASNHQGHLVDAIISSSDILSDAIGVDHKALKDHLKKSFPEYGQRLYFGKSPSSVSFWSNSGKNEAHYAADEFKKMMSGKDFSNPAARLKLQSKMMLKSFADQMTGGYYSDVSAKLKYGKPQTSVSIDSIKDLSKELVKHPKSNIVFRTSIPTETVAHMKDFPGFRHAVASMPGVKTFLSGLIPNSDPSKDISIAKDVASEFIDKVHIVDQKTGKVLKEINIKNFKKNPIKILGGSGFRGRNLKASIIPALLTGIGGGMIYSGIKGDKEKTASVNKKILATSIIAPAAMSTIPALSAIIAKKVFNKEVPESSGSVFKDMVNEGKYEEKVVPPTIIATSLLSAGLGAAVSKKGYKSLGALGGGYVGGLIGSSTKMVPKIIKNIKEDPRHSVLFTSPLMMNKKYRDWSVKNPELAYLNEGLSAGIPFAAAYVAAKKYYPYHSGLVSKHIDKVKEALSNKAVQQHAKDFVAKNHKNLILAAGGLTGLLATVSYLGSRLKQTVGEAGLKVTEKQ